MVALLDRLRRMSNHIAGAGLVQERSSSVWGDWGDPVPTWSGQNVTPDLALQLAAVYGSVGLITDSISTLPVDVYRKRDDGKREEITPPFWLTQPTVDLDYASWCSQVLISLLLDGNAYVVILENDR